MDAILTACLFAIAYPDTVELADVDTFLEILESMSL